jgi:hypothetical protein
MATILLLIALLTAGHSVSSEDCELDLLFLIDGSSSICEGKPADDCPNWNSIIDFMKDIVKHRKIGPEGTKVALVTFGNEPEFRWNLNQYTNEASLSEAFDSEKLPGGQLTGTGSFRDAVAKVFSAAGGDRSGYPNVVILISDGSTVTPEQAGYVSGQLQEEFDAKVFAVCVTDICPEEGAKAVSSYPHESGVTYFMPKKYLLLSSLRVKLENQICDLLRAEKVDPAQ